jgi:predicted nucleotidyltransferase
VKRNALVAAAGGLKIMAGDYVTQAAATEFAEAVAQSWLGQIGPRVTGIYLIGSLAHGGFSARYSDIDVALITETLLGAGEIDVIRGSIAGDREALTSRLSVFWTDRGFSGGRFPPLDRIDYLDHAVRLFEREHICPARPELGEIRSYLAAEPFCKWREEVERLSSLDELTARDHKRYLRALLYPARFLYSWETGRITSNDEAVAFLQRRAPAGLDLDIIGRALECRNSGNDSHELFGERGKLRGLRNACAQITAI